MFVSAKENEQQKVHIRLYRSKVLVIINAKLNLLFKDHAQKFECPRGYVLIELKFVVFENRNLGKSGLRVSQFGLGTWVTFGSQISDEVAEDILTAAYQSGINLFDTCEVYAAGK